MPLMYFLFPRCLFLVWMRLVLLLVLPLLLGPLLPVLPLSPVLPLLLSVLLLTLCCRPLLPGYPLLAAECVGPVAATAAQVVSWLEYPPDHGSVVIVSGLPGADRRRVSCRIGDPVD